MKNFKMLLGFVFIGIVFVLPLEAGVLMVSKNKSYDDPKEALTINAYLDKDRMLIETKGNIDQGFIFRKDKEVFWFIDNKDKSYTEMTKQDLLKLKKQMEDAMKMVEEQMKNIPPEQKAMMESMMKGQMPGKTPDMNYKKIASGQKINQWLCDKYEGYINKDKVEEMWTTDWQKLGLTVNDFKVIEAMKDFMGDFLKSAVGQLSSFCKISSEKPGKETAFYGVPVKTLTYSEGKVMQETELSEVKRQNFAASLFEIPKGFTKKEMPGMSTE